LAWTPPGGGSPTSLNSPGADITGKIKQGSDTTEVKP
jgi:hypothetical protein